MSNTYDDAYEAIVANEVIDLTSQVMSPYGAEAFVGSWIADPSAVLAGLYNVAVSATEGRDDHIIAAVVRASLSGQIRKAAEHTVSHHRTDLIQKVIEDANMSPATHRKMEAT